MNIEKYNFTSSLNLNRQNNTALVFASYQPNKISSDILRIALDSLEKINLENISVWIIDVGSPKSDDLVKQHEFKNFNFLYVNFTPRSWERTSFFEKIFKIIFLQNAPRSGSHANAWTLEFALSYFDKINYHPDFFMTLQNDVIFTDFNSISDLRKKMIENKNFIAAGFREQDNLGKTYKIIHSLACMWNLKLFKKLNLNLYPDFPNYDIAEKSMAVAIDKGYKILGYRNLRTEKLLESEYISEKFLSLGNGVDICVNEKLNVVFLHLGRGIDKSKDINFNSEKFSPLDWINWYKTNFKN